MSYFKNVKSLEDLKAKYKKLAVINHPDNGGNIEEMQKINAEYDTLFPIWKSKKVFSTGEEVTESAYSTRNEFYTQNGWRGENFNSNLTTTEIAKRLRTYVKEMYPTWKFSITSSYFSMGSEINISVMEAPYDIFNRENVKNHTYWNLDDENIHIQLNRIDDDTYSRYFVESAFIVLKDVYNQMQSYNYEDIDSMIDYCNVRFYSFFNIGKWDKGFKVVEKTARIKNKSNKNEVNTGVKEAITNTDTQQSNENKDVTDYTYTVTEDKDTRDNSTIYLVKVEESLSKVEYIKVNKYIKSLGGYYSKFKHAFLFKENPTNKLNVPEHEEKDNRNTCNEENAQNEKQLNSDNVTDKEMNNTEHELKQNCIQEEKEQPKEVISIIYNNDMGTIEIHIENGTEKTINLLKANGFIYLSMLKAYVIDNTFNNRQFVENQFQCIV